MRGEAWVIPPRIIRLPIVPVVVLLVALLAERNHVGWPFLAYSLVCAMMNLQIIHGVAELAAILSVIKRPLSDFPPVVGLEIRLILCLVH
jgi:hypothetical protein